MCYLWVRRHRRRPVESQPQPNRRAAPIAIRFYILYIKRPTSTIPTTTTGVSCVDQACKCTSCRKMLCCLGILYVSQSPDT
jgi:hypothetical protein